MPRPWRIEYVGACYHVMNRGSARRNIFHSDSDRRLFIMLLQEINLRYNIEILAYCLMDNHYHLCLRTPSKQLGLAIQFLQSLYTRKINKRCALDGPLFRGRYKAILVSNDYYLINVSRYVHLNPVKPGLVQNPSQYEWSSASYYTRLGNAPEWMSHHFILKLFDEYYPQKTYESFLFEGVDDETRNFFDSTKKLPIFSDQNFIRSIVDDHFPEVQKHQLEELEVSRHFSVAKLQPSFHDILTVTADYFNVPKANLIHFKNTLPDRIARNFCIYLCVELTPATQHEIGQWFNNISSRAVSLTYRKIKIQCEAVMNIRKQMEKLKELILNGCTGKTEM